MLHSKLHQFSILLIYTAVTVCTSSISNLIPPPASLVSNECKDFSNFCPKGKQSGYCKSTVGYVRNFMETYCKKTCGLCQIKEKEVKCEDKTQYCSYGISQGDCDSKKSYIKRYMKKYCKKSCGFCREPKPVCKDTISEDSCQRYKRYGRCDRVDQRPFMNQNCKKTCELCDLSKTYPCGISKARQRAGNRPIVGGKTAKKGYWPWQIALEKGGEFKCGGTLVNSRFVITAAHCITSKNADDYKVILGEHNRKVPEGTEESIKVKRIQVHPYYVPGVENDIAILQLEKEAVLTAFVTPACLPKSDEGAEPGAKCYITGWGRKLIVEGAATLLQQATMKILDHRECEKQNRYTSRKVIPTMVCARNEENIFTSGCHGDSGGPLVCEKNGRMVLQGVVSWGSPTCDALDHYTVFTRVTSFQPWIKNIIES